MYAKEYEAIVHYRRSNRAFDAGIEVLDQIIERNLAHSVLAPNSNNIQLWEFHWIKSQEALAQFAPLCLDQRAAKTTKHLIVLVTRRDK